MAEAFSHRGENVGCYKAQGRETNWEGEKMAWDSRARLEL